MTTEAEAVAKIVTENAKAHILHNAEGRQFLVVPEKFSWTEVSNEHGQKLARPDYISQHVGLQTVDSVVEYVNRGIEIPTKFKLSIPVYFGEPDMELFAFLRWRLGDGNLTLGIKLHRAEHVRQAVFKQIVLSAAERTGCPAVFGKIG